MSIIRNFLREGEILKRGDAIVSNNGRFYLTLQESDGNLVLYDLAGGPPPAKPLWSSDTVRNGIYSWGILEGQLTLYDIRPIPSWTSDSKRGRNHVLIVQDDGNVVIYQPAWATNTAVP